MTGKAKNGTRIGNTNSGTVATTAGDYRYQGSTGTWQVYTDHTNNTYDTSTANGWITIYPDYIYSDIDSEITIGEGTLEWDLRATWWLPKQCLCCEKDIKEEDDGLYIQIGKKTLWFHRRCFADKRNSKYIRSIIISEDLELV